jgi:hypothetical protein
MKSKKSMRKFVSLGVIGLTISLLTVLSKSFIIGLTYIPKYINIYEYSEQDQDEKMDLSFTEYVRLAQRNSPLPILQRLPPNAASLQFGFFICTDSLSSSPAAVWKHRLGNS